MSTRRSFFGRLLGGFAAALGLRNVAIVRNAQTGVYLTSSGRWEGIIRPDPSGAAYNYTVSDAVYTVKLGPGIRVDTERNVLVLE